MARRALLLLLLASLSLQEIKILEGKDRIRDSFIFPRGLIEFDLAENIDLSRVKYPLSFNIFSKDKPGDNKADFGLSYRDDLNRVFPVTPANKNLTGFGQIAWVKSLTKNSLLLVSSDMQRIVFRQIHGEKPYDGAFTLVDLTGKPLTADQSCEDAVYETSSQNIILACRNKAQNLLVLHTFDPLTANKQAVQIKSQSFQLSFKNRINLNLMDKSLLGTKRNVLTVGDSRSSLSLDQNIDDSHQLHIFELVMDMSKPKHQIELTFEKIEGVEKVAFPSETYSLHDVIKNGSSLYLLLAEKDGDKNYCLTELKILKGEIPKLEFSEKNPLYVSDVSSSNGYLGMTDHDQDGYLVRIKNEDGTLLIQKNTLKSKIQAEEYKWIGETTYIESETDFGIREGKIAVRDVQLGYNNAFLIKTITSDNQGTIED